MTLRFDFDVLARGVHADDLDAGQAKLVVAMRLWTFCLKLGHHPCGHFERQLGSPAAARDFMMLMSFMAAAWPDPIRVHSPCCRRISGDEALMLDMVAMATRGRRGTFDALLCEMLNEDARDRLFAASTRLAATLNA